MAVGIADGSSIQVGVHTVAREGPLLHIVTRGIISHADMEQFVVHYEAMIEEQGFMLTLIHMQAGTDMGMDSRRMASEWGSRHGHCVRSAVYGASFFLRTALDLINRAANALTRNAPGLAFFNTDQEARAWLLAQIPTLTAANPRT